MSEYLIQLNSCLFVGNMKGVGALIITILISLNVVAQSVDWYELVIIPDLTNSHFLITPIDSVGMRCKQGKKERYCSRAEEVHDIKLAQLNMQQRQTMAGLEIQYTWIDPDSLNSDQYLDLDKYPFIIDHDYDLLELEKPKSSVIYLKLDFIIIDRKTNKIVGRCHNSDITDPFGPLERLIDELLKLNQGQ